jgi:hypothetical protein
LTVGVITEYLHLWNILTEVQLLQGVEVSHFWRFATNGQFTVKSAYESFFRGSVEFEHYVRVWKMWAQAKCRHFIWLVANRKCWTTDRLAMWGMDHPEKCPLCDQEQETIDHLLVSCVFARQFWFSLLQRLQFQEFTPQVDTFSFMDWWQRMNDLPLGPRKKGLNSMIVLGTWILWKHRNRCVFDGLLAWQLL